ncbi:MAG: hypothetical protein H0X33_03740 [Taibaiella sp.]|nr:hypothetical protein [Taibaiella sp.]
MHPTEQDPSETLQEIRSIMERSARFLSLSGWSGVWAGCVALIGALIAHDWLQRLNWNPSRYTDLIRMKFIFLGIIIFIAALGGGYLLTLLKVKQQKQQFWNHASRQLVLQIAIPLLAGGFFVIGFLNYGNEMYIAPSCLIFYGLALLNGSKYTLTDIRYLGYLEITLGCICIFFPGTGLYFWAAGFGVLHILYGIIMWNKYDRKKVQ